jgi:hypothetical protein
MQKLGEFLVYKADFRVLQTLVNAPLKQWLQDFK